MLTMAILAQSGTVGTVFSESVKGWSGALFILSLVTNTLATLLIAYKVWYVDQ
jgi:hypothetical protein